LKTLHELTSCVGHKHHSQDSIQIIVSQYLTEKAVSKFHVTQKSYALRLQIFHSICFHIRKKTWDFYISKSRPQQWHKFICTQEISFGLQCHHTRLVSDCTSSLCILDLSKIALEPKITELLEAFDGSQMLLLVGIIFLAQITYIKFSVRKNWAQLCCAEQNCIHSASQHWT